MTMNIGVRSLAVAIGVTVAAGHAGYAQQSAPTDTAAVVGRYEFSLTPLNGEPITGTLAIRVTKGAWRGVVTSPKLAEPDDVDELRVHGNEVHASILGGAYTFDFAVEAGGIREAMFAKTLRGTTERGTLRIKKVTASP
jgi:hypothetical protein